MRLVPVLALLLAGCADGVVLTGDDFVVDTDTRIRPGIYHVVDAAGDGVIQIAADGVTLDLTDVTIVGHAEGAAPAPDQMTGIGVLGDGRKNVTIRGGWLSGFKVGVALRRCPGAVVEDVSFPRNFRQRLGSTVEREDPSDWLRPHDNENGEWETRYGAAISLADSPDGTVRRCFAREGQNGLLLTRSDGAQAYDNDFSFLSGWGVALYRTRRTTICRNSLDWCVRGYSHGRYDRGQDSAGILLFEQCSDNVIAMNSATHGGDGLFIYAGEETLRRTGEGGCNDNHVFGNDFSHSVANAIEATFSSGNRFADNVLDDSRHGVWAGYSRETTIEGNVIRGCEHGVSIEHGTKNVIRRNVIRDCGVGVQLWWDDDEDLLATPFADKQDVRSAFNRIGPHNRFTGNERTVVLSSDQATQITRNVLAGEPSRIVLRGTATGIEIEGNEATSAPVEIRAEHEGRARFSAPRGAFLAPRVEGNGKVYVVLDGDPGLMHLEHADEHGHEHGHEHGDEHAGDVVLPGSRDPFRSPSDSPHGRRFILVDEWGPLDPLATRVFPARQDGGGDATFSVLGAAGKPWRVTDVEGDVVVEPRAGELPGVLRVRAAEGERGVQPFQLIIDAGGEEHTASGSVVVAEWDVRFFRWERDPREDEDAWRTLLAGEPLERRRLRTIDFQWQARPVSEAVGADGFGTLATTTLDLPAGVWRLVTTSDDGIRAWVNGELVIDDWTHHGPTEHSARLDLDAGEHEVRVEHFELTGWAVLAVRLVRE